MKGRRVAVAALSDTLIERLFAEKSSSAALLCLAVISGSAALRFPIVCKLWIGRQTDRWKRGTSALIVTRRMGSKVSGFPQHTGRASFVAAAIFARTGVRLKHKTILYGDKCGDSVYLVIRAWRERHEATGFLELFNGSG